jgi:hypothetical protein
MKNFTVENETNQEFDEYLLLNSFNKFYLKTHVAQYVRTPHLGHTMLWKRKIHTLFVCMILRDNKYCKLYKWHPA